MTKPQGRKNDEARMTKSAHRPLQVVALAVVLLAAVAAGWQFWWRAAGRADHLLAEARTRLIAGEASEAEKAAVAALELDPGLEEAALIAAEAAAEAGAFRRAVDHAERLTSGDARIRLRAALLAADVHFRRLHRLANAERHYRAALEIDPDNIEANTGLAKLLGLCGRRDEAVVHVLRLLRQREATDLLIMLGRESAVVREPGLLERARRADPEDPNPLVGLAWHAADSDQIEEAIELLREAIRLQPDHIAAHLALGQQLLAAGRSDELLAWLRRLPPAADEFAGPWLVRARMAENGGDRKGAIRCYWEAARRAPASKTANFRLARLLAESGAADASAPFAEQIQRIQRLETMQDRFEPSVDYLLELVQTYEAAGRLWEAYGWCRIAVENAPFREDAQRSLAELRRQVEGLPLRLTVDSANAALAVDLSEYPLPRFSSHLQAEPEGAQEPAGSSRSTLSFRDAGASAGLRFRYFNGSEGSAPRRMIEFTGGGIGVLDFDLDGFGDVYFTQGRPWPPEGRGSRVESREPPEGRGARVEGREPEGRYSDRLFRNARGEWFEDVTAAAGIGEDDFGQGVAVGDFDADGFPDLYVANIGGNRLWRNKGDGTFMDATAAAGVAGDEWTTSCVLADLNGDGLPDIYDVNYVTGPDVFERICRHPDGRPGLCMPFRFDGQRDRLWVNEGNGRFREATDDVLSIQPDGKGLGAAVWDADGTGRLSLLVANDTTPNFFFVPEVGPDGRFRLEERGIATGLALNNEGKAEGCMGIALGDV
ncbi:MAG: VCBS repeat-containing protein, partial [Planctomycetes bacterium]|nr:VCBS repeat-containing protein [Planctomycetota bacterium]